MKVNSQNIGKILAKINIHEHILTIFLIDFINILTKTIKSEKYLGPKQFSLISHNDLKKDSVQLLLSKYWSQVLLHS